MGKYKSTPFSNVGKISGSGEKIVLCVSAKLVLAEDNLQILRSDTSLWAGMIICKGFNYV